MRPTHLSFHLDQDLYALPLNQVRELVDFLPSFWSADNLANLRGFMDLRGSLRVLLMTSLSEAEAAAHARALFLSES